MSLRKKIAVLSLRFWIGLSIVLMSVCLILVMTLSNMASEIRVMPQLFRPDTMTANQFLEATAINPRVPIKEGKLIDEMMIRFYVENRYFYVPDVPELIYRYGRNGPIARLSVPAVYSAFIKGKGNYLENVQGSNYTISADILEIERVDNVFNVDFDIYRFADNRASLIGRKRATITIAHRWNPRWIVRSYKGDFFNPYGFVVTRYIESDIQRR